MCRYTKLILNPKYRATKKNGYNPPKCKDNRVKYVPVACGHCIDCRKKRKREWMIRLCEAIRANPKALFITLTFNDKSIKHLQQITNSKDDNVIAKKAIRLWLERIRKRTKKSIKHWFITELGEENGRIHLHGIVWTNNKKDIEAWGYGYTYIGKFVNEKTINYITKYMLKLNPSDREFRAKVFCSPKIGIEYMYREDTISNNLYNEHGETNEQYKYRNGQESILPDYYRHKIYTDEEREKLWIEKQELKYRWIMGMKVSTEDEKEYTEMLKMAQRDNERIMGKTEAEWDAEKEKKRLKRMKEYRKKAVENLNKSVNK